MVGGFLVVRFGVAERRTGYPPTAPFVLSRFTTSINPSPGAIGFAQVVQIHGDGPIDRTGDTCTSMVRWGASTLEARALGPKENLLPRPPARPQLIFPGGGYSQRRTATSQTHRTAPSRSSRQRRGTGNADAASSLSPLGQQRLAAALAGLRRPPGWGAA